MKPKMDLQWNSVSESNFKIILSSLNPELENEDKKIHLHLSQ